MECLRERDPRWVGAEPLYLTLPGADGRDLLMARDEGLIGVTEVGSLAPEHMEKVVAVESSLHAVANLLRVLPGLKVLEQPIQSLIRGEGMTSWPEARDRRWCRAIVVNLDLNQPFTGRTRDGTPTYPIANWVRKLGVLHAESPAVPWSLLLTLHGEAVLDAEARAETRTALIDNAARVESFREGLQRLIGVDPAALDASDASFALDREEMHRLLLALVPKRLAKELPPGWGMAVRWCYTYGGSESDAPMVAFRMDFDPSDPRSATPPAIYESAVAGILDRVGHIAQDGSLQQ